MFLVYIYAYCLYFFLHYVIRYMHRFPLPNEMQSRFSLDLAHIFQVFFYFIKYMFWMSVQREYRTNYIRGKATNMESILWINFFFYALCILICLQGKTTMYWDWHVHIYFVFRFQTENGDRNCESNDFWGSFFILLLPSV